MKFIIFSILKQGNRTRREWKMDIPMKVNHLLKLFKLL
jgi:hypothetical protein